MSAPLHRALFGLALALASVAEGRAQDHAGHVQAPPVVAETDHSKMDHSKMDHSKMDHSKMDHSVAPAVPAAPTDAEVAKAFPVLAPHVMPDNAIESYVLFNQLEGWNGDGPSGVSWAGQAWVGTDTRRLWLRTEGERVAGETESADLELLYGRSISRWWEAVAGVRHDAAPGSAQSWVGVGVMGLAPQKFEVAATAYAGPSGRSAARVEIEYELLLGHRWILQPRLEANLFGQNDAARGVGSGLSTVEAGLRLRYEVTRRFAPYVGLVRERAFGATGDFRRQAGDDDDAWQVVAGVRVWF